ncbi:sigma-70 family RNA polymerase sigma factor [Herbaspirillum sp. LeCh32-8]|uniref:sigma-70 family RNA polymerase sigma factor n=1 Tax=Herbaspirillum sp. LeCh32-8 TaxID=2821356 RepID=UPI001AEA3922|nr:sigma-70 family RNA polymerase sigma factor [Herbaspirillum sp. LeCh32-8]MBP0599015.1 sigma-70 family RNA polymerase sigma factor [Herbaspirillum sp. LeCh32-8]
MTVGGLGKNEFLSLLFREHHGWLAAWLRKKTGCPHHAADLAQEAFARILSLADPASLQQPRAFMVTTATRLIIDEERRRRLERAYLDALALMRDAQQECADSPEQILLAVEALNAIAAMLEGLPEKPRRAFLLNRLDGLSHAEIAAELKVSTSMVKQYLAAATLHCYRALYPGVASSRAA